MGDITRGEGDLTLVDGDLTLVDGDLTLTGGDLTLEDQVQQFALFTGTSGDIISTPDSPATSITSDIDIRIDCAPVDWTPASDTIFVQKWNNTGSQASYQFSFSNANAGVMALSITGSGGPAGFSTAATGFVDGSRHSMRFTWDDSINETEFFTADDFTNFAQLGNPVTVSAASIFDSTAAVEIGSFAGATIRIFDGKIFRMQIYDGINGTLVADFNANDYVSGSTLVSSTTGETWTLGGAVTIIS